MHDRTVMICVGATKAGTSWLYDYLSSHPQVALRAVKELHYFDALDLGQTWVKKHHRDDIAQAMTRLEGAEPGSPRAGRLARRVRDTGEILALIERGEVDVEAYLAYLGAEAGAAKLVGDITPAYALLPEERLADLARMARDVKIVFVMRDPLDRLWSHVRMNAARALPKGGDLAAAASALLARVLGGKGAGITDRGDYPAIVAKLMRAVPAENLLLAFSEELITPEGVAGLCDFLGLDAHPADTAKRVHEGARVKLDERQKRQALEFLAPHYAFVKETFGALPAKWQANDAGV